VATDAILVDSALTVVADVPTDVEISADLDEEMFDYEPTPERTKVNVVYFSSNYNVVGDDSRTAQFDFTTQSAIFQNPEDSINHLKPLHVKGHINGMPVHNILVDSGAIVNLMPYSLYKKLGGTADELIKTNMTISGVGGCDPIPTKGVASMELTIGSKTLATAFFVAEVQGSYNLDLSMIGFMQISVSLLACTNFSFSGW
jgi:hypothetical protein